MYWRCVYKDSVPNCAKLTVGWSNAWVPTTTYIIVMKQYVHTYIHTEGTSVLYVPGTFPRAVLPSRPWHLLSHHPAIAAHYAITHTDIYTYVVISMVSAHIHTYIQRKYNAYECTFIKINTNFMSGILALSVRSCCFASTLVGASRATWMRSNSSALHNLYKDR